MLLSKLPLPEHLSGIALPMSRVELAADKTVVYC